VTGVTGSGAPVLVVGAGPSGLFAAVQLARLAGWHELAGPAHHLLLSGADPGGLARFLDRWGSLVEVVRGSSHPAEAGGPSAVLIRPDGYIGFRARPADAAGMEALDAHLNSYLIPDQGQ